MTDKDWDYIARLEKAIKKKYGSEAVVNPKNSWTDEKEEEYLKELKGFSKVFLASGESRKVTISLNKRDLSFWDIHTNDWLAEAGEFEVLLGSSLDNIHQTASFIYQQ